MKIGIIGAGIIGSSWAIASLKKGFEVSIYDCHLSQHEKEIRKKEIVSSLLSSQVSSGDVQKRLNFLNDLDAFSDPGLAYIQESIIEDQKAKKSLYLKLDKLVPDSVILASSSSALTASALMGELDSRHRCIVAHPATPPHLLPAVEVVPAPFTSETTVSNTQRILKALGQKPVLIHKELDGFVMNRLQGALLMEMLGMIRDGIVTPEGADTLIRDAFGIRWSVLGPLEGVHINAPGGIEDYFTRYQNMFKKITHSPSELDHLLDKTMLAQLQEYCTSSTPVSEIPHRQSWRNAMLEEISLWRNKVGIS